METLLASSAYTVRLLNGSEESVRVRQFHLAEFQAFAEAASDEARLICFYTGKPPDWPATLTMESWEGLLAVAERVNAETLDFFCRWLDRQKKWSDRILRQLTESTSPTGLPNSASKPG